MLKTIIKRDGRTAEFHPQKIADAVEKSFQACAAMQDRATAEQIAAGDSQRPRRAVPGAGATAPQPAAPGEADRRAREDMERMRALLRQEKEGK